MGSFCEYISLVSLENQGKNLIKKNEFTTCSRAIAAKVIYQFRIGPDINTVFYGLCINHNYKVFLLSLVSSTIFSSCKLIAVIILRKCNDTL